MKLENIVSCFFSEIYLSSYRSNSNIHFIILSEIITIQLLFPPSIRNIFLRVQSQIEQIVKHSQIFLFTLREITYNSH